jgi:hypothetical protein
MWKANGNTTTLLLFLDSLFQKQKQMRDASLETKQSGGKLLPHSDLRGGVFLGETPRGVTARNTDKSRRRRKKITASR